MRPNSYARFKNDTLILRDELAIDRTVLANERTLMAYLRSAVSLLIAGVTIINFADQAWFMWIGAGCLPVGLLTGILGIIRYRHMAAVIAVVRDREESPPPAS
jgi:putative membrane protein